MHHVPELVEERLDLAMVEQRGLPGRSRGRHVGDDDRDVLELVLRAGEPIDDAAHPGAVALRLAGEEIEIERADARATLVDDGPRGDVVVPDASGGIALDGDSVEAGGDLEETARDAIEREIRAKRLLVEVEERAALGLGPVRDVPGLERALVSALLREGGELGVLALEAGAEAIAQHRDEGEGVLAGLRHAVVGGEIREVREAEELGLLLTEREDLLDDAAVVALRTAGAGAGTRASSARGRASRGACDRGGTS